MKKVVLLIMGCLFTSFAGCEYKNEEDLFGEKEACREAVSFAAEIEPLIQANCALSGCHATGGVFPELSTFEKIKASAADVKQVTQSLQMPPPSSGKSLNQQQIDLIACWVGQGALNN